MIFVPVLIFRLGGCTPGRVFLSFPPLPVCPADCKPSATVLDRLMWWIRTYIILVELGHTYRKVYWNKLAKQNYRKTVICLRKKLIIYLQEDKKVTIRKHFSVLFFGSSFGNDGSVLQNNMQKGGVKQKLRWIRFNNWCENVNNSPTTGAR